MGGRLRFRPGAGRERARVERRRYAVVDMGLEAVEEIKPRGVLERAHPGAVYLNQARTFLVKALDVEARVARVRRADVKYFTRSVDTTRLTLVDNSEAEGGRPRAARRTFPRAFSAAKSATPPPRKPRRARW